MVELPKELITYILLSVEGEDFERFVNGDLVLLNPMLQNTINERLSSEMLYFLNLQSFDEN